MQFYLNGYKPGDPFVEEPHPSVAARSDALPEEVDVLIVGCGPQAWCSRPSWRPSRTSAPP
jgi:phenol 2-monooxygenase